MIQHREPPVPGQLASSGLTMVEEALYRGRLVPRCWSSTGFVAGRLWPAHGGVPMEQNLPDIDALPAESFDLEMDGQSLAGGWDWEGGERIDDGPSGQERGVIRLRNAIRPVDIILRTASDQTGFLVRDMTITSRAERPSALSRVAPWSGLLWGLPWEGPRAVTRELIGEEASPFSLGRCTEEEWGREGAFRFRPLGHGVTRIEHTKGSSGNDDPSVVLRNEITGELCVLCLAWSGNWAITLRAFIPDSAHAWLAFRVEPLGDAPLRVLAPGESITTPGVHLGLFRGDLDTAVQALHEHERRSVLPPQPEGRGERVIYNHWGYGEWQMNPAYLEGEMDIAREVGAELFVVDAGWFSPLDTVWANSVGTWRPHPDRFPEGFLPLVRSAHAKGLLMGLWMEAERVTAGSWIATEHPAWVLHRDGRELGIPGTEPGGLLDLAQPECAAWLEEEIERVVREYELDMFRLDYNAYPGRGGQHEIAGYRESELWRHVEAIYGIFDRLRARHPRLILENCAGGGARKDLGIAARFHTLWTSDWQSVPRTLQVLNGVSMFLPPERMNRLAGGRRPRSSSVTSIRSSAFLSSPITRSRASPRTGPCGTRRRRSESATTCGCTANGSDPGSPAAASITIPRSSPATPSRVVGACWNTRPPTGAAAWRGSSVSPAKPPRRGASSRAVWIAGRGIGCAGTGRGRWRRWTGCVWPRRASRCAARCLSRRSSCSSSGSDLLPRVTARGIP
jgi:alpha-galactosidase